MLLSKLPGTPLGTDYGMLVGILVGVLLGDWLIPSTVMLVHFSGSPIASVFPTTRLPTRVLRGNGVGATSHFRNSIYSLIHSTGL